MELLDSQAEEPPTPTLSISPSAQARAKNAALGRQRKSKRGNDFSSEHALEALAEHEDEQEPTTLSTEVSGDKNVVSALLGFAPSNQTTPTTLVPPQGAPPMPPKIAPPAPPQDNKNMVLPPAQTNPTALTLPQGAPPTPPAPMPPNNVPPTPPQNKQGIAPPPPQTNPFVPMAPQGAPPTPAPTPPMPPTLAPPQNNQGIAPPPAQTKPTMPMALQGAPPTPLAPTAPPAPTTLSTEVSGDKNVLSALLGFAPSNQTTPTTLAPPQGPPPMPPKSAPPAPPQNNQGIVPPPPLTNPTAPMAPHGAPPTPAPTPPMPPTLAPPQNNQGIAPPAQTNPTMTMALQEAPPSPSAPTAPPAPTTLSTEVSADKNVLSALLGFAPSNQTAPTAPMPPKNAPPAPPQDNQGIAPPPPLTNPTAPMAPQGAPTTLAPTPPLPPTSAPPKPPQNNQGIAPPPNPKNPTAPMVPQGAPPTPAPTALVPPTSASPAPPKNNRGIAPPPTPTNPTAPMAPQGAPPTPAPTPPMPPTSAPPTPPQNNQGIASPPAQKNQTNLQTTTNNAPSAPPQISQGIGPPAQTSPKAPMPPLEPPTPEQNNQGIAPPAPQTNPTALMPYEGTTPAPPQINQGLGPNTNPKSQMLPQTAPPAPPRDHEGIIPPPTQMKPSALVAPVVTLSPPSFAAEQNDHGITLAESSALKAKRNSLTPLTIPISDFASKLKTSSSTSARQGESELSPKTAVPALPIHQRVQDRTSPGKNAFKSQESSEPGSSKSVRFQDSEVRFFEDCLAPLQEQQHQEKKTETSIETLERKPTKAVKSVVSDIKQDSLKDDATQMTTLGRSSVEAKQMEMQLPPSVAVGPPSEQRLPPTEDISIMLHAKERLQRDLRALRDDEGMGIKLYNRLTSGSAGTANPTPQVLRYMLLRAGGVGVTIDAGKLEQAWPPERRSESCDSASDFCKDWLPKIVASVEAALDDSACTLMLSPEIPFWVEEWASSAAGQNPPSAVQRDDDDQQLGERSHTSKDSAIKDRLETQKVLQKTISSIKALKDDPKALHQTGEALCQPYRIGGRSESGGDEMRRDVSRAVVPATLLRLWEHMQRSGIFLNGNKMEVDWTEELWFVSHPNEASRMSLSRSEFSTSVLPRIIDSMVSSVGEAEEISTKLPSDPPQWLENWVSQTASAFRSNIAVANFGTNEDIASDAHVRCGAQNSADDPLGFGITTLKQGTAWMSLTLPPTRQHPQLPPAENVALASTSLSSPSRSPKRGYPELEEFIDSPNRRHHVPQGVGGTAEQSWAANLRNSKNRSTFPSPARSMQDKLDDTMQVGPQCNLFSKTTLGETNLGTAAMTMGGLRAAETMQLLQRSLERKQELDKTLGLLETWHPRTAADFTSFKETSDSVKAHAMEVGEQLHGLEVTLDVTLGTSEPENMFRAKAMEAIGDILNGLECTQSKLATMANKRHTSGKDSNPLVIGVIGIEDPIVTSKLRGCVREEARRILQEGLHPSSPASKELLECARQLFVRRFNTNLFMWRVMAPGGKTSVGMRDIAHGIYRADKIALPRNILRAIWIEALQGSLTPDENTNQGAMRKRSRKVADVRCASGCAVCGMTLKAPLEGIELERLDFVGFSRAFAPSTASDPPRCRKAIGDVAGNTTGPVHTNWLRLGSNETRTPHAMAQDIDSEPKTCDLLACLLDEAQGMDAQTFRRAVWAGLSRECAARINMARKHRKHAMKHAFETSPEIARGNLHDANCKMAELLEEWHAIQALRGFFGILVEYPGDIRLEDDFQTIEKDALRKVEIEEPSLDYAEETFAQTVVTSVTIGGLSHKAGVVVGSRVVSCGIQSSTYDILAGCWGINKKSNQMVHVVAFVPPEHREGGSAMKELLASSRPGNCMDDFEKVIRRLCQKPDGKCRYTIHQVSAMWEAISAHGNHDNLRITRFMANRALGKIGMRMPVSGLTQIFQSIQENEQQATQKDRDRRISSAFRSLNCVSEARRRDATMMPDKIGFRTLRSEPFNDALIRVNDKCLSECPRCTTCHGWGHTAEAPHLVNEYHSRCHRRLEGCWAATDETPPNWSGYCEGYGHAAFQCPGRYVSGALSGVEGSICKLCLGEHTGGRQLLGTHPQFESFLARHGPCRACHGIGHWWRACPHGKVDTVNLHDFVRKRAIYMADMLRVLSEL